jgi:hypothetical protein
MTLTQEQANEINEMNQVAQNTLLGDRIRDLESAPAPSGGIVGLDIPAGSADLPPANYADFFREVGTNIYKDTYDLDDGGLKYYYFLWKAPSALLATNTLKIIVDGSAKTHVASKSIELNIGVSAQEIDDNFDIAFVDHATGALALGSTGQGNRDELSYSATASVLGISAGDIVVLRVKRKTGANDTLVGDYQVRYQRIEVS